MSAPETYVEVHGTWGQLNGWATIDSCDSIGGYEWDEFHVMRGPDGRLYVGSATGCSCNSFSDTHPTELTPVTNWQDAVKRLGEWVRRDGYMEEQRKTVADELRARLAQKRPRARIAHDPTKGFDR